MSGEIAAIRNASERLPHFPIGKGFPMSQPEDFRRLVELGKATVKQGAIVARQVAGTVSAEAARQAEIAKPIVRETSRKAWVEIQRQATAAKPVVQEVTKRAAAATWEGSRHAGRLIFSASLRGIEHAVPMIRRWNQQFPLAAQASLACVAGLFGAFLLAGSSWYSNDGAPPVVTAEIQPNSPDVATGFQPVAESPVEEQAAIEAEETIDDEVVAQTQSLDAFEQWRHQPPPTTVEYEGSMSQYNAQAAPSRVQYTPQQMGRFAAAGYRPHLQPQRYPR